MLLANTGCYGMNRKKYMLLANTGCYGMNRKKYIILIINKG
jgi:hypothetical protein